MQPEDKMDRVQANTSAESNLKIAKETEVSIREYAEKSAEQITERINKLHKEWDIERWLEMNASLFALIGVLLGFFVNIYWLLLPMVVLIFLLQHAIQGWCPPVPLFRWLKVRTQQEIDQEIYALKVLRGDLNEATRVSSKADHALMFIKR
jgi:hypothetical protein